MGKNKAFTLIELLVVISIIILLLSILLPVTNKVRMQARSVVCQAHLNQWGTTLSIYANSQDGLIHNSPMWIMLNRSFGPDNPVEPEEYHSINIKNLLCPMATDTGGSFLGAITFHEKGWHFTIEGGSTFEAWELKEPGHPIKCSYGLNSVLFVTNNPYPDLTINIYLLKNTSAMPFVLDSSSPGAAHGDSFSPPHHEGIGGCLAPCCINRHNETINCLFLDWSVRKIGLKELWTLKWSEDFDTSGPWTRAGGVKPEDWPEWMRGFKDY